MLTLHARVVISFPKWHKSKINVNLMWSQTYNVSLYLPRVSSHTVLFPSVFIYTMPGYNCSIKERMLYSSAKGSLIERLESQLGLEITKKVRNHLTTFVEHGNSVGLVIYLWNSPCSTTYHAKWQIVASETECDGLWKKKSKSTKCTPRQKSAHLMSKNVPLLPRSRWTAATSWRRSSWCPRCTRSRTWTGPSSPSRRRRAGATAGSPSSRSHERTAAQPPQEVNDTFI